MSDTQTLTSEPLPKAERKTLLPSVSELNRMTHLAKAYADAGMARNAGEALARIQAGWELGAGPGTAMTEISIIDGQGGRKLSLSPLLMRALVRTHGLGSIDPVKQDAESCVCRVTRNDWPAERAELVGFGVDDAVAAELMTRNARGEAAAHPKHKNYDRYRPDMFLARASARAWRRYFPELAAGLPYCAEELGADVDESGKPLELAELPQAPSLPTLPSLLPVQPFAADAPTPAPSLTPAPADGQNTAANADKPANAGDAVAAGLQAIEQRIVARDRAEEARTALTLLRWDTPTWRQFLQHHFGKQRFADLPEQQQLQAITQLERLHTCERLRAECRIDDAGWRTAKAKRGVEHDWQLSPSDTVIIVGKLADSLSPFRRQELGLADALGIGTAGGNGSAPAAGGSPAPAQPPALVGTGPTPALRPSLIPPALQAQAA